MKEYLNNIDQEDYHKIVYKTVLDGDMVGQLLLDGNMLLTPNPERHVIKPIEKPQDFTFFNRHPLQGEFILTRPWDNKLGGK